MHVGSIATPFQIFVNMGAAIGPTCTNIGTLERTQPKKHILNGR